jgi:thiamine phosphate synthase YjbQ (UPF0047 family)
VTSVEIPYSIAAVLPTLTVMDITNDLNRPGPSLIRINERETGIFEDVECLLERLVPLGNEQRQRLVQMLLGPRTEQVPFRDGAFCLGTYQRVLLFSFGGHRGRDWTLTLLG